MTSAFLLRSLGSQSRIGTNPRYISQEHSNISTPLNPCQITCSEFQISNRKWAFQVAQWVQNLPANAEDARDHSWDGKIPWRRKWQRTPYSCLENSMDREAWWATVHGVTKSQTRLSIQQQKVVFCFLHHIGSECFCGRILTLGIFLKNLEKFNE